jgi:hypothetical protein
VPRGFRTVLNADQGDSDHHQRADGHVVAVGITAATQASQGSVAAVVTTAATEWSLVLVVLEVRGIRRGGAVLRAQDNPAGRRIRSRTPAVKRPPTDAEDQGRAEEAGGKRGLVEFGSSSGPWALTVGLPALSFGRDGGQAEGSFGSSAAAT